MQLLNGGRKFKGKEKPKSMVEYDFQGPTIILN